MEYHHILGQNQNPTGSSKTNEPSKQSATMVKEETTETETGLLLLNSTNRICGVCGKGFGNAKALNGHMRVHFHSRTSFNATNGECNSSSKPRRRCSKMKRKVSSSGDHQGRVVVVVGNDEVCCPVCSKGFGSKKALYGHMRCHSGRGWRGMLPPTTPPLTASTRRANLESSLSHSDDDRLSPRSSGDSIRASSDLSWSRKGKRGRDDVKKLSKRGQGFVGGGDVDLMMWDAAEKLLELGRYGPDQEEGTSSMEATRRRLIHNAFLPRDSIYEKRSSWFEEFDEYIGEKRRRKAVFLNSMKPEWDSDDEYYLSGLLPVGWDADFDVRVDRIGRDEDHYPDLLNRPTGSSLSLLSPSLFHIPKPISSPDPKKKKVKRSHHQLHNESSDHSPDGSATSQNGTAAPEYDEAETVQGVFKCKHCAKTFATGQALGGHQRAHYVPAGGPTTGTSVPAFASTSQNDDQDSDTAGPKGLPLFDLKGKIATGRALGGYQGAQNVPAGGLVAAKSEPASTTTSTSQDNQDSETNGRKGLLLFDLNEPAAMEEQAIDHGQSISMELHMFL